MTDRRLTRVNLAAAIAFVLGGSLFALGAFLAQTGVVSTTTVNVTYLVGGVFFSLGGYSSVLLATNTTTDGDHPGTSISDRWRWWAFRTDSIGWWSAAVLFVGTLFFGISLIAAFAQNLTPRQSNGWIWFPDIIGCVCFLVSGHLALREVCQGRIGLRLEDFGWWIVAVNQFGSILFFLAGIAAFTRPATSESIDIGLVNWGTFAGALCFAIAGVMQAFQRPPSRDTDPADADATDSGP